MHKYTHEYKPAKNGTFIYLGSRCGTESCPDSRNRATLETVKVHNDRTGAMFSRRFSQVVSK